MTDKHELSLNYWLVKAYGAQEHMERWSLNNKTLSTAFGRTNALWEIPRSQQQIRVCTVAKPTSLSSAGLPWSWELSFVSPSPQCTYVSFCFLIYRTREVELTV